MYRGKQVVAWVPFGRERTVSILHKYLLMDKVIDQIWLCMNTDPGQVSDREYAEQLTAEHQKITMLPCPGPATPDDVRVPSEWKVGYRQPKQMNTGRFPIYMQDRDTVYLRFDDDIIWIHEDTPKTLVDRVLDRRQDTLGVFALIYNNAICSWLLQKNNRIPLDWGIVGANALDPHQVSATDRIGWENPDFAIRLHGMVLDKIEAGRDDELKLGAEMTLGWRQQFSVSCFGIAGDEYADLGGILDWDEEEHWLTMHRTGVVRKSNIVCGSAPVAHLSFFTQAAIHSTDILERYRAVCDAKWRNWYIGMGYYDRIIEARDAEQAEAEAEQASST